MKCLAFVSLAQSGYDNVNFSLDLSFGKIEVFCHVLLAVMVPEMHLKNCSMLYICNHKNAFYFNSTYQTLSTKVLSIYKFGYETLILWYYSKQNIKKEYFLTLIMFWTDKTQKQCYWISLRAQSAKICFFKYSATLLTILLLSNFVCKLIWVL